MKLNKENKLLFKTGYSPARLVAFIILIFVFFALIYNRSLETNEPININLVLVLVGLFWIFYMLFLGSITTYALYENELIIVTPFRPLKKNLKLSYDEIDKIVYYFNRYTDQIRFILKDGSLKHAYFNRGFFRNNSFREIMGVFKEKGISINRRTIFHNYKEYKEEEW
jgi:hypothetical protein